MRQQMRLYTVIAQGDVADIRTWPKRDPALLHPLDYSAGQALGRAVRNAGGAGIVYPSVRDPRGECLAAFRTALLRDCHHAAYLEYNWNGSAVDAVFELNHRLGRSRASAPISTYRHLKAAASRPRGVRVPRPASSTRCARCAARRA